MSTIFSSPDELLDATGQHLGYGPWLEVTQERINQFAEATGDLQWIHIDPSRAASESPYGATIAHGYLTLSLTNMFMSDILKVENISMGINYGANKIRFPAPVIVGSEVRVGAELISVEPIGGSTNGGVQGVQATLKITVEVKGQEKPACVVESLSRFMSLPAS